MAEEPPATAEATFSGCDSASIGGSGGNLFTSKLKLELLEVVAQGVKDALVQWRQEIQREMALGHPQVAKASFSAVQEHSKLRKVASEPAQFGAEPQGKTNGASACLVQSRPRFPPACNGIAEEQLGEPRSCELSDSVPLPGAPCPLGSAGSPLPPDGDSPTMEGRSQSKIEVPSTEGRSQSKIGVPSMFPDLLVATASSPRGFGLPSRSKVEAVRKERSTSVRGRRVAVFQQALSRASTWSWFRSIFFLLRTTRRSPSVCRQATHTSACSGRCGPFVKSVAFDCLSFVAILANAVFIGIQTHDMASERAAEVGAAYRVLGIMFLFLFSSELVMRIEAYRGSYFDAMGWFWGVFDCSLVVLQLAEEATALSVSATIGQDKISFLRTMRVLRLTRVLRLIRIIRYVRELSTLVDSIRNCAKSFLWTLVLLFLCLYLGAVYFTQLALDYRLMHEPDSQLEHDLKAIFGNITLSMFSLYQAMSGGVDWEELSGPLIKYISPLQGLLFAFYVAFMVLALTNVVTGIFVDGAMTGARREDEKTMVRTLCKMFEQHLGISASRHLGISLTTEMDYEDFEEVLSTVGMTKYLSSIDVDPEEAKMLGRILVANSAGRNIDYEEFVAGCLKLRGTARATDLLHLASRVNTFFTDMAEKMDSIQGQLERFTAKP